MASVRLSLFLSIAVLISAVTVLGNDSRVNKSTQGLFWSTVKEESDFLRKVDSEEHVSLTENDELDGGFSSLDGMLQWAIGNVILDFEFDTSANFYSPRHYMLTLFIPKRN